MTLKSLNFSLLVVTLESEELSLLADELSKKRIMAPDFFLHAPVVVKLESATLNVDFLKIKEIVIEQGFVLAGISGELSDIQKTNLHNDKIAILRNSRKQVAKQAVVEDKPIENEIETASFVANEIKTKIFTGRVRSGQQIYAKECDLVINGDVGAGAEVIADGNIHIYGVLRGKALAGAMGDQEASIFCQLLAPELVSIAGVYKLSDDLSRDYVGKGCVVSLLDEQITLNSLNKIEIK